MSDAVYLRQDEISITNTLNRFAGLGQANWLSQKSFRLVKNHPNITFGSYPSWSGQHYRTKVTLEGELQEEVSRARSDMEELKPVKFDPNPTENAWEKVQQFLQDTADSHMTEVVEASLKVVEECFARFSHPCVHCVQALMLALHVLYQVSSGKCVRVLQWGQGLHCDAPPCACILPGSLLKETFSFKWYRENKWQKHFPGKQLKSFYISEEKTFPELDQFLASSIAAYNLHNSVFQGKIL